MDSGTLALMAHLLISTGCKDTDIDYRDACSAGYSQASKQSGLSEQAESKEKELSKAAQDFAGQYLFPYLGREMVIVTFTSIDAVMKGEVRYAVKAKPICDSILIVAGKETTSIKMNWNF